MSQSTMEIFLTAMNLRSLAREEYLKKKQEDYEKEFGFSKITFKSMLLDEAEKLGKEIERQESRVSSKTPITCSLYFHNYLPAAPLGKSFWKEDIDLLFCDIVAIFKIDLFVIQKTKKTKREVLEEEYIKNGGGLTTEQLNQIAARYNFSKKAFSNIYGEIKDDLNSKK